MPVIGRDAVNLRVLGARLREARESVRWTRQQLAGRLGMSPTAVVAIEKGERRLKPAELIQLASLFGCDISYLLQRGATAEGLGGQLHKDDEILSPQQIALAVEAWQRGELSEGQLAKVLHTDRLGVREIIQKLERSAADESDPGEPIDFGAPGP